MLNKIILIQLFILISVLSFANDSTLIKADRYFHSKMYGYAIKEYKKEIRKNPNNIRMRIQLGLCYYYIAEYEQSFIIFDKLKAKNEFINHTEALFCYANLLKIKEKYNEAKVIFEKLLNQNPNDILSKNALAICNSMEKLQTSPSNYTISLSKELSSDKNEFIGGLFNNQVLIAKEVESTNLFDKNISPYDYKYFYNIFYLKNKKLRKFLKNFNQDFSYVGPVAISPDKKEVAITYTTYNPIKQKNHSQLIIGEYKNGKLYNITSFPYNSEEYNIGHACYSKDGNTIYFVSDMPGSIGKTDIWMCKKDNQKWNKPINLGETINTKGKELFPFIIGNKLYFSSDGWPCIGGLDIFSAIYQNNRWQMNKREDYPLNSSYDDFAIVFTSDSTGYFTSNRPSDLGGDNIYLLKAKSSHLNISGKILLSREPKYPAIKIKLWLLNRNFQKIDSSYTNENGDFTFNLLDYENTYYIQVGSDDSLFLKKTKFYLMFNNQVIRTTKTIYGHKFVFELLPFEKYPVIDALGDNDLSIGGLILLKLKNNETIQIKNARLILKNAQGDYIDTAYTNEHGLFVFRYLDYQNNFTLVFDDINQDIPFGTKIIIKNKNGNTVKELSYDKNLFNLLEFNTREIELLSLNDDDLIFALNTYLKTKDFKPLSNININIHDANKIIQSIQTDASGKFCITNNKYKNAIFFSINSYEKNNLGHLNEILITDSKNRIIKRLVKNIKGEFTFNLLEFKNLSLQEIPGDDPTLTISYLRKRNKINGQILSEPNPDKVISNIKVYLCNSDYTKIDSAFTDSTGYFEFQNITSPYNYYLLINSKDKNLFTNKNLYLFKNNKMLCLGRLKNNHFIFNLLDYEKNILNDFHEEELILSGNILSLQNNIIPIKNVKLIIKNKNGEILGSCVTNDFGNFVFRYLDFNQEYFIEIYNDSLSLPNGTKIILTNKNGKEIKSVTYDPTKFKYQLLSIDKSDLTEMKQECDELVFTLKGYLKNTNLEPLKNIQIKIVGHENFYYSIRSDTNGMFLFDNLKYTKGVWFVVDGKSDKLKNIDKIYITDRKNTIIKTLIRGIDGNFSINLLDYTKTSLVEYYTDDPWMKVLRLKKLHSNDSITVIENINYRLNEYKFDATGKIVLDKIMLILKNNTNLKIEINSHTDSRADDNYNLKLSEKRAQFVADYLIKNGIDKNRIKAKGYGETKLINHCINNIDCPEELHAINRRTEFIIKSIK